MFLISCWKTTFESKLTEEGWNQLYFNANKGKLECFRQIIQFKILECESSKVGRDFLMFDIEALM